MRSTFVRSAAPAFLVLVASFAGACGGTSTRRGPDDAGGTGAIGGSSATGGSGATGGAGVGGGATGGFGAVGGGATGGFGAVGGVGATGGFGAVGAMGGAGGSVIGGCFDPDGTGTFGAPVLNGYDVRSTTVGVNGSFVDACDANGNLTEYACDQGPCFLASEEAPGAEPGSSGGAPCPPPSGWVIPTTIDCDGLCSEGTCFPWCANTGDTFFVMSVDPSAGLVLEDVQTGDYFMCTVGPSQLGVDCTSPDMTNSRLTVTMPGACLEGSTSFVADHPIIGGTQGCNYECKPAVLID